MFELMPFGKRNNMNIYDPFEEMKRWEDRFFSNNSWRNTFKCDIRDNGDSYLLEADLPGMEKKDIQIEVDKDYLTITAQRNNTFEQKDNNGNVVHSERSFGTFSRSFDLTGVKSDEIKASFKNGVLTLVLPKENGKLNSKRQLQIED